MVRELILFSNGRDESGTSNGMKAIQRGAQLHHENRTTGFESRTEKIPPAISLIPAVEDLYIRARTHIATEFQGADNVTVIR